MMEKNTDTVTASSIRYTVQNVSELIGSDVIIYANCDCTIHNVASTDLNFCTINKFWLYRSVFSNIWFFFLSEQDQKFKENCICWYSEKLDNKRYWASEFNKKKIKCALFFGFSASISDPVCIKRVSWMKNNHVHDNNINSLLYEMGY